MPIPRPANASTSTPQWLLHYQDQAWKCGQAAESLNCQGKSHRTKHLPSPTSIPYVETGECCSPLALARPAFGIDMKAPERAGQMLIIICNPFCKMIYDLYLVPKMACHFLTSLSWAGA